MRRELPLPHRVFRKNDRAWTDPVPVSIRQRRKWKEKQAAFRRQYRYAARSCGTLKWYVWAGTIRTEKTIR
ncbi:hypothetical protein GSVR_11880 [Geobacter sp. SVR]|nr:hypothetical protein GSVR_11880 [Geobacter sp. SVR]